MCAGVLKDALNPSDHIWFQERFQEAAVKRYGRLQAACNEAVGSGAVPFPPLHRCKLCAHRTLRRHRRICSIGCSISADSGKVRWHEELLNCCSPAWLCCEGNKAWTVHDRTCCMQTT